jgi:hypothetical protein
MLVLLDAAAVMQIGDVVQVMDTVVSEVDGKFALN